MFTFTSNAEKSSNPLVGAIHFFTRKGTAKKKTRRHTMQTKRYQCVEIVAPEGTVDSRQLCNAYHAQKGQRYLATDAPALPLAGCDRGQCKCRYKHFGDRRVEERRNSFGMNNAINRSSTRVEQRCKSDRRRK